MANLKAAVRDLRKSRQELSSELDRLDQAIHLLNGSKRGRGGTRTMSASGRSRISEAQKARWAKWKAKHGKKPVGRVSARDLTTVMPRKYRRAA